MATITTHVLDTSKGKPAAGVDVVLERKDGTAFVEVSKGTTDADGRLKTLTDAAGAAGVAAGTYRLTFNVGMYFAKNDVDSFFPEAAITFQIVDAAGHFHVPLLLAPYGFSTYRGS